MGKLNDFLINKQILEEVESPINGKLTVVRDLISGIHIKTNDITQSGGIAQEIWEVAFNAIAQKDISTILIVGFGGGGIAKVARKDWLDAKITGIEIDPLMIDLGRKYLGLDKLNAEIKIGDGVSTCKKLLKQKQKFDLICIDTYVGDNFPEKFETKEFLETIKKLLSEKGIAIFNRLYYMEKIQLAINFQKHLEEVFSSIEIVKPEANIMFICSHS